MRSSKVSGDDPLERIGIELATAASDDFNQLLEELRQFARKSPNRDSVTPMLLDLELAHHRQVQRACRIGLRLNPHS